MLRKMMLVLATILLFLVGSEAGASSSRGYCRADAADVVFLIDRTTTFDEIDREVLLTGLTSVVKNLKSGIRLKVATIEQSMAESVTLFNDCWPGCWEQGAWASLMDSCRPELAKLHRRQKTATLAAKVRELVSTPKASRSSDILRTLAEQVRGRTTAELIIFSDMLENSSHLPASSLLGSNPDLLATKMSAVLDLSGLKDVAVIIYGYGRSHLPGRPGLGLADDRQLRKFWGRLLRESGARSVEMGHQYPGHAHDRTP